MSNITFTDNDFHTTSLDQNYWNKPTQVTNEILMVTKQSLYYMMTYLPPKVQLLEVC